MGEKEDREKAEKLAAAKKRVAQLQAKKKKAAATGDDKSTETESSKAKGKKKSDKDKDKHVEDETPAGEEVTEDVQDGDTKEESEEKAAEESTPAALDTTTREPLGHDEDEDEDTAEFNNAIKAANDTALADAQDQTHADSTFPPSKPRQHPGRQPSLSLQSKMRSTSFRQAPLSPTGLPDEGSDSLYKKQMLRIEELERKNKRLAKEATDGEARWRKSEEELEELREKAAEQTNTSADGNEMERLRTEIDTLRRSQRQSVSVGAGKARSGSIQGDDSELRREVESKDSTISDLQLEISRLRSRLSSQTEGCETHGEQISALQLSLERAESSAKKLGMELSDTKKALSRASEKAVVDGIEWTSKETKIRGLEKENEDLNSEASEMKTRMEGLEKKIEAMNKLHRETEDRSGKKLASAEAQARETPALREKLETQAKEITRLREARKRTLSGSGGDDGLDELEDEDRKRLERRVRELEGEVFELRRGVWRDRRKEMQPGMADEGDEFDDVDLSGSMPASRRRSSTPRQSLGAGQTRHSGLTQVLSSGLAAFRGSATSPVADGAQSGTRPRNDSLLEEFDDDEAFDMNAFATAQREEEMKKMVEHVKEVKRGLKQWVGWRLDLVDSRRGGGGIGVGEVFDI